MNRAFLLATCGALALAGAAVAAPPDFAPAVGRSARHDVSPRLRDIPARPPQAGPDREVPIHRPPDLAARHKPTTPAGDPVRQTQAQPTPSATLTPLPSRSFDGISDDDNSAVLGFRVVPPDTEGDVGPNHYVQWVNLLLAVYDKSGNLIFGPVAGNSIWTGFGGICETNNDGDPVVLYDHLADRWLVSQFAIGADGHECIAVSTTGDPTGSYFRYDFTISPGAFNDYPKLGVWPDGYYLTANDFGAGFLGASAVAFERDKMLAGQPAQFIKFGPLGCGTECFFSLQPSDLDGPPPAAGTPNTFVQSWDDETWGTGVNSDGYRLWDFHVDWVSPGSSSFTALPQVDAPEFDANMCNFNVRCIPQPHPGEKLDPLAQFTMYRAQYRSFATHATMVVNHTVDSDGGNLAGIRWAELRRDAGGWFLHQTGTLAPADGVHRWMGSAAMDQAGNIALGYTVSSTGVFPSIRYVTREAGDPLGQLPGGEVTLVAGGGVQRQSFNRWGDYATMSVDPADGCTFWHTNEYYANSGSFDFKTRIGAFKLDSCVGGGGCSPQGASCTSDEQCCSGNCKGKPGAQTCK